MIKVQELIVTDLTRTGSGESRLSPARRILEVYNKDGDLVAFHDAWGNFSIEDLIAFERFRRENNKLPITEVLAAWPKTRHLFS